MQLENCSLLFLALLGDFRAIFLKSNNPQINHLYLLSKYPLAGSHQIK